MPAQKAKIVAFPSAEPLPKPSPNVYVMPRLSQKPDTGVFRGGSLRGLFWAVVLEGSLLFMAAGIVITWNFLRR